MSVKSRMVKEERERECFMVGKITSCLWAKIKIDRRCERIIAYLQILALFDLQEAAGA